MKQGRNDIVALRSAKGDRREDSEYVMFTLKDMRSLLDARPFQPFRLYSSDGGHVDIITPEMALAAKQCAIIGILDPNTADKSFDRWHILWYLHISRYEMLTPGKPPLSPPGPAEASQPSSI